MTDQDIPFRAHRINQRKSDGTFKTREIMVPSDETRTRHQEMLELFYSLDIPMPYATGGQPGKGLLDNVVPHKENRDFYLLDLSDAFASVDVEHLIAMAKSPLVPAAFEEEVEAFIRQWATTPDAPGLPLGAPCSPFLFNLYCLPLDRAVGKFCDKEGITFTRYLDDLTFSAKRVIGKRTRHELRQVIIRSSGMAINDKKTRHHNLAVAPVTITGISLQPDGRIQPSPQLLEQARVVFEGAAKAIEAGHQLSETEIGELHGWNSVLKAMSIEETPAIRTLRGRYRPILGMLGLALAQDAR